MFSSDQENIPVEIGKRAMLRLTLLNRKNGLSFSDLQKKYLGTSSRLSAVHMDNEYYNHRDLTQARIQYFDSLCSFYNEPVKKIYHMHKLDLETTQYRLMGVPSYNIGPLQVYNDMAMDLNLATIEEIIYCNDNDVVFPTYKDDKVQNGRFLVKAKIGQLYFEFCPTGKDCFVLELYLIDKQNKKRYPLFKIANERYGFFCFEHILPIKLHSFNSSGTDLGASLEKYNEESYKLLNQLHGLNCILTNLLLNKGITLNDITYLNNFTSDINLLNQFWKADLKITPTYKNEYFWHCGAINLNELNFLNINNDILGQSNSPDIKTDTLGQSNSPDIKTDTLGQSNSPEIKTDTLGQSNSPEIKTDTLGQSNSPEIKTDTLGQSSSPEIKTDTLGQSSSPEIKTDTLGQSNSLNIKNDNEITYSKKDGTYVLLDTDNFFHNLFDSLQSKQAYFFGNYQIYKNNETLSLNKGSGTPGIVFKRNPGTVMVCNNISADSSISKEVQNSTESKNITRDQISYQIWNMQKNFLESELKQANEFLLFISRKSEDQIIINIIMLLNSLTEQLKFNGISLNAAQAKAKTIINVANLTPAQALYLKQAILGDESLDFLKKETTTTSVVSVGTLFNSLFGNNSSSFRNNSSSFDDINKLLDAKIAQAKNSNLMDQNSTVNNSTIINDITIANNSNLQLPTSNIVNNNKHGIISVPSVNTNATKQSLPPGNGNAAIVNNKDKKSSVLSSAKPVPKQPDCDVNGTPYDFICPITLEIMNDPVKCQLDGRNYERNAIEQWLKTNGTSPLTRTKMKDGQSILDVLSANQELKTAINNFKDDKQLSATKTATKIFKC